MARRSGMGAGLGTDRTPGVTYKAIVKLTLAELFPLEEPSPLFDSSPAKATPSAAMDMP